MGINSVVLAWLDYLAETGAFTGYNSIFELGPQDLFFSRSELERIVRKRFRADKMEPILTRIYDSNAVGTSAQSSFYRLFGFEQYSSCDAIDKRAEFKIDLNSPIPSVGRYDCVTNIGTSEHVFNIAQVFASVHRILKTSGLALHVLPTFGDLNHGFYNVHPVLYFDVARVNGYEVIDIRYVDNMNLRAAHQSGTPSKDQLSLLSIDLKAECTQINLSRRLSDLYAQNVASEATRDMLAKDPTSYVVDYCFAALRKPSRESEFVMPMQSSTAGWIHSGK